MHTTVSQAVLAPPAPCSTAQSCTEHACFYVQLCMSTKNYMSLNMHTAVSQAELTLQPRSSSGSRTLQAFPCNNLCGA
jgi:hypothetical protein